MSRCARRPSCSMGGRRSRFLQRCWELALRRNEGARATNMWYQGFMRSFDSLSAREILALAISVEGEDERVYADFAEGLRDDFPASAAIFEGMRDEESGHRRRL